MLPGDWWVRERAQLGTPSLPGLKVDFRVFTAFSFQMLPHQFLEWGSGEGPSSPG